MKVDTARGAFEVIDEGDRSAPTVVLVHGFPFSSEAWRDDAAALAQRLRIVAPSMRGFGGTPSVAEVSVDAMADDVAAVLDTLGVTSPVVMGGLSMGGYVTLAFARRHATRVRALVLADTRADADSDEARANRDAAIARVEKGELEGVVDGLLEKIVSPKTRAKRPHVFERIRRMMLAATPASVIAMLRALRDRPDARPGLAAIAVPVLVVVGEDDALMPPAISEGLAAGLRDSRIVTIPEAGHISNLENPDAFRAALSSVVSALVPSPT